MKKKLYILGFCAIPAGVLLGRLVSGGLGTAVIKLGAACAIAVLCRRISETVKEPFIKDLINGTRYERELAQ